MRRYFIFFVLSAAVAWADGGIMGQVRDLHGQAVAGATIRLVNGETRTVQSGENGRFELDGLPVGADSIHEESWSDGGGVMFVIASMDTHLVA